MIRWLYIIIGVLVGCTGRGNKDNIVPAVSDDTTVWHINNNPELLTDRHARIKSEIAYYLERHSAADEGYDMVLRYAKYGDSTLAAYLPAEPFQLRNIGRWKGIPRQGTGLTRDTAGRMIIGTFDNDTLVSGLRLDTAGIYAGRLSHCGEAEGHGAYRSLEGSFYEGQWKSDMRDGFGIGVAPAYLHVGHWRKNRFHGERMNHTGDHIYGIDISRYQHERGRKRSAIDWRRLRITSLGHRISQERVSGTVDYPVSFVYIKSTEGISIKNKYFMSDYSAARSQGLAVGAYHFFSTRQSAAAQASFFLQNSCFRRGDLPPILDIEPTDALVRAMGGEEVLFSQIRLWLKRVEERVGARPILYVNQDFARKYLENAPDLKQDYQVWVARYGEFKPDVHLTFWQLSSDGRVSGIKGECDINVFNGFQNQWDDFLREHTVK